MTFCPCTKYLLKGLKNVVFFYLQYDSRSSRSTTDLQTVVSERIPMAFINRPGATWALAFDISKASNRIWHAHLLHKLSFMEFQFRYLAFFLLSSVIDSFECSWMGSLYKNIQSMLEFLKALFLGLHFSHYTLMTFLMMLSLILLSMLMMLLSVLTVIRHLICGNS